MKQVILFTLFSFVLIASTIAQGQMSFHIGAALPTADYGDDSSSDSDAGRASIGLNAGLQYDYPISDNGLSLIGGIDVVYNGLDADFKDDIEDLNPDADVTFYNFVHVPISGGLGYNANLSGGPGIFLHAQVAFNVLKLTNYTFDFGDAGEDEFTFEMSTKLGFKFGGGIQLNESTSIAIHYYGIGEHDIDFDRDNPAGSSRGDTEQDVSFVTLTVGFNLK